MRVCASEGGEAARAVMTGLITNTELLGRVSRIWDNKEGLFGSGWENTIGRWCVTHFNEHGVAPGRNIYDHLAGWAEGNPNDDQFAIINGQLGELLADYDRQDRSADVGNLVRLAEDHFNRVRIRKHKTLLEVAAESHNGKMKEALERAEGFKRISLAGDEDGRQYRFAPRTPAQLIEKAARPEWLVEGIFVRGQPLVIGGPKKALKTSLAVDLAVSLATGEPFLGSFPVPKPVRVAFISGESGEWAVTRTVQRVYAAKRPRLGRPRGGKAPAPYDWTKLDNLLVDFRLPQLGRMTDLRALAHGLEEFGAEVVFIDPLYLCLLAGTEGKSASNLYDVGPLLYEASRACLGVGSTPGLLHHAVKALAPGEPCELEHLSMSGIAEFARQWLLINRRERFDPDSGRHALWVSVGGSCGQAGLWAVDVDEGQLGDDFGGRHWRVAVEGAGQSRGRQRLRQQERKEEERRQDYADEEAKVLAALDRLDPDGVGVSYNKVALSCGLGHRKMAAAAQRLVEQNDLAETEVVAQIGSGGRRTAKGLKRVVRG